LVEIQRHVGLALGAAAGARLAQRLGLAVSGSTLLRLVRHHASSRTKPAPRVIGIDGWAWKRGYGYESIVCDLERRHIIDDGPAATRACPSAKQVADRWHLIENASAAFLDAVRRSMPLIRTAIGATTINPVLPTCAERRQHDGYLRREDANAIIRRLADAGAPIQEIVRRIGRSRKVVRAVVRGGGSEFFRVRMTSLDAFLSHLVAEWTGGCRNAAELWRRLKAVGFLGALRVVSEWAAP